MKKEIEISPKRKVKGNESKHLSKVDGEDEAEGEREREKGSGNMTERDYKVKASRGGRRRTQR